MTNPFTQFIDNPPQVFGEKTEPTTPDHWAVKDIAQRSETIKRLNAEIAAIDADPIWSDTGRKRARQPKIRELSQAQNTQSVRDRLAAEIETVEIKHNELIQQAQFSDPLNQGSGVQNASIELDSIAQQARNFEEFQAQYNATSDPFLRRAFQLKGASIASQRWPGTPQVGSFKKQLQDDKINYYRTDESRALLDKAKSGYPGAVAVVRFENQQFRAERGMSGFYDRPAPDHPLVQAENIQGRYQRFIAENDPDHFSRGGFNGGFYDGR